MGLGGGGVREAQKYNNKPPDKGSFPLDHDGERGSGRLGDPDREQDCPAHRDLSAVSLSPLLSHTLSPLCIADVARGGGQLGTGSNLSL